MENSLTDGRLFVLEAEEQISCTIIGTTVTKETTVKDNKGNDVVLKSKVIELLPKYTGSPLDEVSGKAFKFALTSTAHPRVLELVEQLEKKDLDKVPAIEKTMTITQAMVSFKEPFYVTTRSEDGILHTIKDSKGKDIIASNMPIRKLKGEGSVTNSDAFRLAVRIAGMAAKGGGFVKKVEGIEADGSYNGVILSKSASKQVANDLDILDPA